MVVFSFPAGIWTAGITVDTWQVLRLLKDKLRQETSLVVQ